MLGWFDCPWSRSPDRFPTALLGTAPQEVDTVSIMAPVVKRAVMVRRVQGYPHARRCVRVSQGGPAGPVLVDIPKDVQQARASGNAGAACSGRARSASDEQLARCAELLADRAPHSPAVGGGVALSGAHGALAELAHHQDIPVACTLMGLGCFDPTMRCLGMPGCAAPFTNLVREAAGDCSRWARASMTALPAN
jgi:acetolactate synthase-1/2/3 large subunit